jgi:Homeodomain-like domain
MKIQGMDSPTVPQDDRRDKPFAEAVLALRAQGLSIRRTAKELGVPFSRVQRLLARNGAENAPQHAPTESILHPVIMETTTLAELRSHVEAIKQQVMLLTSFMAAMQSRNGAYTAYALHGAEQELGQRFPEPADRRPERWNL